MSTFNFHSLINYLMNIKKHLLINTLLLLDFKCVDFSVFELISVIQYTFQEHKKFSCKTDTEGLIGGRWYVRLFFTEVHLEISLKMLKLIEKIAAHIAIWTRRVYRKWHVQFTVKPEFIEENMKRFSKCSILFCKIFKLLSLLTQYCCLGHTTTRNYVLY